MNFSSDNITGASRPILEAIVAANAGAAKPYGQDEATSEATRRLCEVFEREVAVFLVATGTGANALALASLAQPGTAIFCHEEAHVIEDECGAPEFFAGGAKLVGVPGAAGKVTLEAFETMLERFPRGVVRQVPPAALSLSQATEAGTLYSLAEIAALAEAAHASGLGVHMDGARFANALVALGTSPAAMTWQAGIDVLSLGATKNGALACEAVILFDKTRGEEFGVRRKRGGHTLSKGRLLGAQMNGYLADGHWLDNARHANRAARRLAEGLAALPGVRCPWPSEANEVFAILPCRLDESLRRAGALYYPWVTRSLPAVETPRPDDILVRLICSFETSDDEVDRLVGIARSAL
ncbi:MAG TPA: beta-eliminating lyase-related protein [Lichenihabitans sp.]|jgi:threonine aldolase|nr:beta-eliminating lyase-related protein [Lichenihabitans sp.]